MQLPSVLLIHHHSFPVSSIGHSLKHGSRYIALKTDPLVQSRVCAQRNFVAVATTGDVRILSLDHEQKRPDVTMIMGVIVQNDVHVLKYLLLLFELADSLQCYWSVPDEITTTFTDKYRDRVA